MATKLKPYKIETVSDAARSVHVDVMLDREKKDFFARYDLTNEVRAKTAEECVVAAKKMLTKIAGGYHWQRCIEIDLKSEEDCRHSSAVEHEVQRVEVTMTVRRMERAPKLSDPDGPHHVERTFEEDLRGPHEKKAREEHRDLRTLWEWSPNVIPYTEESWLALLAIMQAFRDARAKVDAILRKKNLPSLLAGMAKRPLLSARSDK